MTLKRYEIFLLVIIGIGFLAAILGINNRWRIESGYRTVSVAVDYFQLHRFARYNGVDINVLLDRLKSDGFTTIAVLEDSPEFLEERGIVSVLKGFSSEKKVLEETAAQRKKEKPEVTYTTQDKLASLVNGLSSNEVHVIIPDSEPYATSLYNAWLNRIGLGKISLKHFDEGFTAITLDGDPETVYQLGAGFVTPLCRELEGRGFDVIPRIKNVRTTDPTGLGKIIESLDFPQNTPIIFSGDEIFGYPSGLNVVADKIRQKGLLFGYIEFAAQEGDRNLGLKLSDSMVRVHSISDEEMDIYWPAKAKTRMVRAAIERNVRVIYLKPFMLAKQGEDSVQVNVDYFKSVRDGLKNAGFNIGPVQPITKDPPKIYTRLFIMLATGAALALLASWGWGIASWIGMAVLLAIFAFLSMGHPESLFIKLGGFASGIAFPSLGLSYVFAYKGRSGKYPTPLVSFLVAISFTIIGGLMTGANFATPSYMMEMDSFSGVKLSFVIPIFLAALMGVRLFFKETKTGFFRELTLLGDLDIKIKHLAALAVLAFAGLILLTRSGNEPLFTVTAAESSFRGFLESIFSVRPRTKEFLIGHPLIILAFYILRTRPVKLASLAFICLIGGVIGQVSMFNTFCHFHTPLAISIERTILGLVLGGIGGVLLVGLLSLVDRSSKTINNK